MSLKEVIFLQDINRLPNQILREICTDLNLEATGTSYDLSKRIWESKQFLNEHTLSKIEKRIFAGRTSVTWYELESELSNTSITTIKEKIKGRQTNLFETKWFPKIENLTTEPVLIAATECNDSSSYYLRFLHKMGVSYDFHGDSSSPRIKTEIINVFVDEDSKLIEIRADASKAKKVASAISNLIDQQSVLKHVDFINSFGSSVHKIADALNGILIDTVGRPEIEPEEFNEDMGKWIVTILSSLDDYFKEKDISLLEERLNSKTLNEEYLSMPFTSLLLSGLETIGLGSVRELRGLPLYDYIEPYLRKQKGSIVFKIAEDGIEIPVSIKVGINTKSISFNTPATEKAINYIRKNVIINRTVEPV